MDRRAAHERRSESRRSKDVNTPPGVKHPKTTALRVTPDELENIRVAAAKRGLTAAAYLRSIVIPIAAKEAAAA